MSQASQGLGCYFASAFKIAAMNEHKIEAVNFSGMAFKTQIGDHQVILDANIDVGGNNLGPSPKIQLLNALAGCTGIDVVSMLNKMRVNFTDFSIEVTGLLADEHPKVYNNIMVNYKIRVAHTDHDKVEKAVKLSKEKYCGVSIMLAKAAKLDKKITFL